jgi:hypothetical protein
MQTPTPETDLSSHLMPLCNGRPGLRGGIHVEVRDPVQSGKDAFHRVPDLQTSVWHFRAMSA